MIAIFARFDGMVDLNRPTRQALRLLSETSRAIAMLSLVTWLGTLEPLVLAM